MLKLVHISDTHLRPFHPEAGDILIHSGDALNYGDFSELIKFREQLKQVHKNYKLIIFCPGNHDRIFEEDPALAKGFLEEAIPNLKCLINESYNFEGYKIYSTPDQPEFCNWAFNRNPMQLAHSYANIPDDVDVLITHCPAKGIRDVVYGKSVGSSELAIHLPRLKKLKLHAFGHIHFSQGLEQVNDIWYSNAAMVDEQYLPGHKENIIELG